MRAIQNICVIGAGTMGGGIAAHFANLGFNVTLLDSTHEHVTAQFAKTQSAKPPHFLLPETASKVRLGNTSENLQWVREADWVCEAIIEQTEAKQRLYALLEPLLAPHAIVTTNTSGLQISVLSEGRGDAFRSKFFGSHFFNPPRHLKLLEIIPTPETSPTVIQQMTDFFEESGGRRVVPAKDTPGFIANRFGMWSMYHATHVAEKLQLSPEAVDQITGPFLGRPKSGTFRLNDIVGLDVMELIASNLRERCSTDPFIAQLSPPKSLSALLDKGWIGEKSGQGFYRREGRELLTYEANTGAYRQKQDVRLPSLDALAKLPMKERLLQAMQGRDELGEFLREYLNPTLAYADYLGESISHTPLDFDRVMKWGFGWQHGPFELLDLLNDGTRPHYYENRQVRVFGHGWTNLPLEPQFRTIEEYPILQRMENFNVRDLGEDVKAIASTTKMGVITPGYVRELSNYLDHNHHPYLVLTSEAKSFSVGFDLNFFLSAIEAKEWEQIDSALVDLHALGQKLSERRTVAAVYGYCLGAGQELAMSCNQVVALAESNIGLPESKVGLIPGGRGTVLVRLFNQANAGRLQELAETLSQGTLSMNSEQAKALGFLRPTDITCFHPDLLLTTARKVVLLPAPEPASDWKTEMGPLSGMIDRGLSELHKAGKLSEKDVQIGHALRNVFAKSSGTPDALTRERHEFVELCKDALTVARIRHMLETGKPLRN